MTFHPLFFVVPTIGTLSLTLAVLSPIIFPLLDAFCPSTLMPLPRAQQYSNFQLFPTAHTTSLRKLSRTVLYISSSSSSSAVSTNPDWMAGISLIDEYNDQIYDQVNQIREKSLYFRLFSVDILASCEYMPQELFECYSESCEVYPVDEEDVSVLVVAAALEDSA
jgi:hypothetical protein